jgi:hypothetical protein
VSRLRGPQQIRGIGGRRQAKGGEVRGELNPELVDRILDEGSQKAAEVARHTMVEVRNAVGLPAYR